MTETEQQIACLEWMGWTYEATPIGGVSSPDHSWASKLPPLTLDTLQPMLERMTRVQWIHFEEGLVNDMGFAPGPWIHETTLVQATLTCPLPILVKRFMVTVGIWKEEAPEEREQSFSLGGPQPKQQNNAAQT